MATRRLRVLLVAETVTLAHLARPLALARLLAPLGVDCALAADGRYDALIGSDTPWAARLPLATIPGARFARALERGAPLYTLDDLSRYVEEDRQLFAAWRPDVVVGDFRLSLGVSARLAGLPYAAIQNAYWLPSMTSALPVPVLPWTGWLPPSWESALFALGLPFAHPLHCRPYNRLCQRHGLPGKVRGIRSLYSEADALLVADWPACYPQLTPTPTQTWIGPLLWSPAVGSPDWWETLPSDRPVVYVSLGSSGQAGLLPQVLEALATLPVTAVVSTAGQPVPPGLPAHIHAAPYLSGEAAVSRAALMVCNGGSLSVQQAALAGIPVLGLPANMDQVMSMQAACAAGLGRALRADRVRPSSARLAISGLLADTVARTAATRLGAQAPMDTAGLALGLLDRLATRGAARLAAQDQK